MGGRAVSRLKADCMAFFLDNIADTAYGIDLGAAGPVIVRASRRGRKVVFSSIPAADKDSMRKFAEACASGRALSVGCMRVKDSFTARFSAPFGSVAKARRIFPSLLGAQLPFDVEDCACEFVQIGKSGKQNNVQALAVAARFSEAAKRLDRYRAAGFDPHALMHEGLALWAQGLREVPPTGVKTRIVALIRSDFAVAVVGVEGSYRNSFSARLDGRDEAGIAGFVEKLKRFLLAEQLPDGPVEWVWADSSGMGAAQPDPLQRRATGLLPGAVLPFREPEFLLARALGAAAVLDEPLRHNLRLGPLAHPMAARRAAAGTRKTAAAYLAAGLLVCAANIAWRSAMELEYEEARQAVALAARELAPRAAPQPGMEVLEAERAAALAADRAAPFHEAMNRSLIAPLSSFLDAALQSGVKIESMSFSRRNLRVQGSARDWETCEAFAARTRELGYSAAIGRAPGAGDAIKFQMTGEGTAE